MILSIGFDRSRDRRQQELTNNKKNKRQISCDNYVEKYFWFCRTQIKRYIRSRLQTDLNKKQ